MAGAITCRLLRNVLIIILLLAGTGPSGKAQQRPEHFEFGHIQEQQGLSFRIITAMLHDRDGFLWIGTTNGLNRYDGSHFVPFKQRRNDPHSLLNNRVYALCEDKQGRIWATFENGISWFDKATGHFHNITAVGGRPLEVCKNIRCDRAGDIWFTSRHLGLFHYCTKTGAIDYLPCYPTDSTGGIRTLPAGLVEDPRQPGFWIAEKHGLRYYDVAKRQYTTVRLNPKKLPIFTDHEASALALDGDRLLISDNTDQCIIVYDLRRQRIVKRLAPTNPTERALFSGASVFVDRQHNLWVSSWDHATFFIDAKTDRITELGRAKNKPTSLDAEGFWAGWQHADGAVWLGTTNGIAHTNPKRALYTVYDLEAMWPNKISQGGISTFTEDPDGSWWLGTGTSGLAHYVPTTNRLDVYPLPTGMGNLPLGNYIRNISLHENELFIGTERLVFRFDKQRHQFQVIPRPKTADHFRLLAFRLLNDTYWAFGDSKQVLAYDLPSQQWRAYPVQSASKDPLFLVRQSLVDKRGQLWIDIYPEGFARFEPQQGCFVVTDTRQADYEATINSLAPGPDGSFLMATDLHGLIQYDPLRGRDMIRAENELMAIGQCTAALPDRFGNTWVAYLNLFSVITQAKKQVLNFSLPLDDRSNGFVTTLFPMRNGHVLSVQRHHLVEFRPENLLLPAPRAMVLLNRVILPDTTFLLHGDRSAIRLAAEDNSFSVEYSVLSATTNYQYRYKLDGSGEDWKEAGVTTTAVYNRLPGGAYTFMVKAIDPQGIETPVRTLPVHIGTHFYRTNWFWALLALGVIGLLVGFFWFRAGQAAQIYHLQVQATRLERDKTQIQYQNLINHLNPHFLFNSLTSLNSLIVSSPREASTFLRKLSIIYRYILQNKGKELVTLDEELAFVQHYIDLQTTRFDAGLRFDIHVANADRARRIVPVTLQNLFENAIKHNTLSDDSPLLIWVYSDGEYLYVANNLQRKRFVETSNKQGLASLQSLYGYLNRRPIEVSETTTAFVVKVPLL